MLSRIVASAVAATLAAASISVAPAHAAATGSAITCRYELRVAWNGGFSADLFITNNGPTIDGWTAHWTFATPTRNLAVWSAEIKQANPYDIVATPMPWNKTIHSGSLVAFGWTASAVATEVPTDITVNGVPC